QATTRPEDSHEAELVASLYHLGDPFDLTASGGSIDVAAAVPKPATWCLSLAGLGLVGLALRRRSDSKSTRPKRPPLPITVLYSPATRHPAGTPRDRRPARA